MLDEQSSGFPVNGSDGNIQVPFKELEKEHRINLARRINGKLDGYEALITAITGLTVAIYILIDVIRSGVGQ